MGWESPVARNLQDASPGAPLLVVLAVGAGLVRPGDDAPDLARPAEAAGPRRPLLHPARLHGPRGRAPAGWRRGPPCLWFGSSLGRASVDRRHIRGWCWFFWWWFGSLWFLRTLKGAELRRVWLEGGKFPQRSRPWGLCRPKMPLASPQRPRNCAAAAPQLPSPSRPPRLPRGGGAATTLLTVRCRVHRSCHCGASQQR